MTEREVSVLTYNVAGLPEGISSSHPATYTSSISKLWNDINIIHVQEDFCYHDSLLLYDTHPYQTVTTGCVPQGSGLNTFSDFPISNVARFPWTDCTGADCLTPKGFFYSQIEVVPGTLIDFYDVHCNAGSSEESLLARRNNIAQLTAYITQNSVGKPVVIMGDFNSRYTRTGDTIRALLNLGFKDVWIEQICEGQIPEYGTNSLTQCDPVRTSTDCERVDKIFYRGSDKVSITPTFFKVDDEHYYYQNNDTLPLSDHWPMFAKLKFEIKH